MTDPRCAHCKAKPCHEGVTDESLLPGFCPIKNFKDLVQATTEKYTSREIQSFYLNSAVIEKEAYDEKAAREEGRIVPVRPRIREIAEFAKRMEYKKIGLCVGHDMLFTMHSTAPVTTLIVKDRLSGHNPVITLYSRYYKDII